MPAASPRPASSGPRHRLAAATAGLAVLLLAACATVPDSGSVQQGTGAAGAAAAAADQGYLLQPVTAKPGPGWSPVQIVSGFLDTTASFAGNYAAAREFLAPGTKWHPNGFAAKVIDSQPQVTQVASPVKPPTQQISATVASVQVTGDQLATVTSGGQYLPASPDPSPYSWSVQLRKIGGQWRITGNRLPTTPPIFEPDFHRVYLPRELYFVAGDGRSLVPDSVFVPLQATAGDVARQLVTALQDGPPDWLDGATGSALRLISSPASVTINAGTATVNLRVSAAVAPKLNTSQIMSQLVWTLAGPSFAQSALVQAVRLEINGYLQSSASWASGRPAADGTTLLSLPQIAGGQPLYTVGSHGVLQKLAVGSTSVTRIPVHAGDGLTPLGAIAVSPGGREVAWASTQSGQGIYYGPLKSGARLDRWAPHGRVTSISWAANGSLWVVAGGEVWMLQPGHPAELLGGVPSGRVLSIRVAPDNVRAAMIVKSRGGAQLMLGAIEYFPNGNSLGPVSMGHTVAVGTDVSNPTQLAWYDPNDIIVLSSSQVGPVLQEVPVDGARATPIVPAAGTQSITSAGPDNPLAAGLAHGGLALTSNLNGTWITRKNAGLYPTYPAG
jgi:hypothetical protein